MTPRTLTPATARKHVTHAVSDVMAVALALQNHPAAFQRAFEQDKGTADEFHQLVDDLYTLAEVIVDEHGQ
jgi:hypothetical protein